MSAPIFGRWALTRHLAVEAAFAGMPVLRFVFRRSGQASPLRRLGERCASKAEQPRAAAASASACVSAEGMRPRDARTSHAAAEVLRCIDRSTHPREQMVIR